jgi:hypothetical protein
MKAWKVKKVQIVGLDTVKRKLSQYCNERFDETKQAFTNELEDLLSVSVEQAPVKTGNLRGSASLEINKAPGVLKARLGYGAEYAIYVHERLEVAHPVGKAKFLEDPVNERRDRLIQNIINRVG